MRRSGAILGKCGLPRSLVVTLLAAFVGLLLVRSPLPAAPAEGPPDLSTESIRRLIDGGRYTEAEAAARQLIARAEQEAGPDSLQAARAIDLLVELFWRTVGGRRPEALPYGQRALAIKEKLLDRDDPDMARSLINLGGVLRQTGDYTGAEDAFERSLAIHEKVFGPRALQVAESLSMLALARQDTGDLAGARRLLEQSLPMLESLLPPDHPDLATGYSNLGIVMRNSGEYAAAIAAHKRALSIREKVLAADHPDIALTLGYLGSLHYLTGDYTRAREMYERTLPLREKAYGPVNPRVAETLNFMADLARDTGNYDEARDLYGRALKIWNATLGPQHPYTALSSEGLAQLLRTMGDLQGAEPLLRQALEVWRKTAGPNHPLVAVNMRNLADVLRERGNYPDARLLYEQSLALLEGAPSPNQPEISASLTGLGDLMADIGDPSAARPMYERSLEIRRRTLGARHPSVAENLIGLARLSWASGAAGPAITMSLEAEAILRDQLKVTARSLSEREALLFEKNRGGGLDLALSAITSRRTPALPETVVARVWDEVVRSRAIVLDEMAARHRTVFDLESPQLLSRVRELDAARDAYARLAVRGRPEEHPDKYRQALERARETMERAERDLASRSARFRQRVARSLVGISGVGAELPEGSALVAYLAYGRHAPTPAAGAPPGRPKPEPSYLALVKLKGHPGVTAVPLGSIASLDTLIGRWRREAGTLATEPSALDRYLQAGEALRAALWDPIAPSLAGARQVFVVPDGAIHTVNLAALPTGAGRYLLETGPLIQYLSAERDLIRPRPTSSPGRGLLVLGGPDYDARAGSGQHAAAATLPSSAAPGDAAAAGSAHCADLQTMRFLPLSGARYEADEVEALWRRKGRTVLKLTGLDAAEEAFKQHAAGQEVLHMATHGFFVRGDCAPLQLSGLALAGANLRGTGGGHGLPEDGILTAEEIASLDLRGVKWAVLSACETGLGPVQAGEGVLGLRRAFEVAGAGTLILSLWEIGDHDARDWIRGLYEERLQGLSTAEAVRRAGVRMIEARRRLGAAATHPHSWGAFVAAGDWR